MSDTAARLDAAIRAARDDAEFIQAAAGLPFEIGLRLGRDPAAPVLPLLGNSLAVSVLLSATTETWSAFSLPLPPVGFHSFTAAAREPERLAVEGDSLHVAQALHALERYFEILRGQIEDTAAPSPVAGMEKITGRYAAMRAGANSLPPLYYERSGNPDGPPLLMLHTAGADSRQYHPLLAHPALQETWDMYAFDMPAHGRSMPAGQGLWQGYRLDKETYAAICAGFIENVINKPAVVLGCSMGAAMSLYVGRRYPDRVAAMVALEAPYRAKGRRTAYLAHPQTNQAAHNPSYVRGLMSPASPLSQRRAAAWIYSQGGFQVYPGDLVFYSEEFDAEADLQGLDGRGKPIHLLTGAYDYSATPADSKRVADLIPGARFTEMPKLGHFPMIENPDALMVHLMPVLEDIRERVRK